MKTYKLGNKIDCIIRSFSPMSIGEDELIFSNQPYTILKDVKANMVFKSNERNSKTKFSELHYSVDSLDEIIISDVELNNKILNLIFSKNEEKFTFQVVNCEVEDNKFYLPKPSSNIFQVFVYDINGKLIAATAEWNNDEIVLDEFEYVDLPNDGYNDNCLVVYSTLGEIGYNINKTENLYLTLDLIITGNEDDELNASYIHVNKCSLSVDKNMYFNNSTNAVDLKFKVIDDDKSYITLK
jgi:hypothetical protein